MGQGRDEHGRFVKGGPGGPGRPRRATEEEYLYALSMAVPPSRWQRIADKLASAAEAGDVQAAKVLVAYLLGTPPTRPAPSLNIDMSKLSLPQLERIANGEDPLVVIATAGVPGDSPPANQ